MSDSPNLSNLMLHHQSSYRCWKTGKWALELSERRDGECFPLGNVSLKGKLPATLEGVLTCAAAGIHWQLQPDGDWLVWMRDGVAIGHLQINITGWFRKAVFRIDSAAGPFTFEAPRTLSTDWRKENICTEVTAPGGWFEICPFPADYPERETGVLDSLVLWLLRSDSQKEADRQKEQERLSGPLHPIGRKLPSNAVGFFTGRGTVAPPHDPVEQWLLVGAAAACHCLYYPGSPG